MWFRHSSCELVAELTDVGAYGLVIQDLVASKDLAGYLLAERRFFLG
jgi:hypothetical protein